MQMILLILHLDVLFYFGKFWVIFTDYENIFSKFDNKICKIGITKANSFACCDPTQP